MFCKLSKHLNFTNLKLPTFIKNGRKFIKNAEKNLKSKTKNCIFNNSIQQTTLLVNRKDCKMVIQIPKDRIHLKI